MDVSITVQAPSGNVLMVSVFRNNVDVKMGLKWTENCEGDIVLISADKEDSNHNQTLQDISWTSDKRSSHVAWRLCNKRLAPPTLFNTGVLHVRFISDKRLGLYDTGFSALYTFHRHPAVPEQLADGTWNCSVSYWPALQAHFPCDLQKNCAEGQDERDCPYTKPQCGLGFITAGRSCFVLVSLGRMVSWSQASDHCVRGGMHLASLNTEAQWRDILDALSLRDSHDVFRGVLIGLSSTTKVFQHEM